MKTILMWTIISILFFGFMFATCIESAKAADLKPALSEEDNAFIGDSYFSKKFPVYDWGIFELQANYADFSCYAFGAVFTISF